MASVLVWLSSLPWMEQQSQCLGDVTGHEALGERKEHELLGVRMECEVLEPRG